MGFVWPSDEALHTSHRPSETCPTSLNRCTERTSSSSIRSYPRTVMKRTQTLGALAALISVLVVAFFPSDPGAQGDPPPAVVAHGSGRIGVYLTSYALTKREVVEGIFTARSAGKIDTVVINVKNMHGELTYSSAVPLAKTLHASTGRLDLGALIPVLHEYGFYVIARQVLFYDPLLSSHLGLVENWVPVDNAVATAYNLAIAEEVASLGFDELQFDYIRYADAGSLESVYDVRYAAVDRFLAEARQRLAHRIALSADLFGRVLWPWNQRRIDPIGQSLEQISAHIDYISPMLYPSHYSEQVYRDDPYRVVSEALSSGKRRVSSSFRPFLQAFDMDLPPGMTLETYIEEQVRAAKQAGADGYLFWHPACEYDSLYRALH